MVSFITFLLGVAYAGIAVKFWQGFERTNFNRSLVNRLSLSLLWPALFVVNPSYRRNFNRALKG